MNRKNIPIPTDDMVVTTMDDLAETMKEHDPKTTGYYVKGQDGSRMVMVPARWYHILTGPGAASVIWTYVVEALCKAADPEVVIRFADWQMDKLDLEQAEMLLRYCDDLLLQQLQGHPFLQKWNDFFGRLREYTGLLRCQKQNQQAVCWVKAGEDYTVYAFCRDNQLRQLDMKPLIAQGWAMRHLEDPVFFRERLAVINDTVAWDVNGDASPYTCIDIDPAYVYEHGTIIPGCGPAWTLHPFGVLYYRGFVGSIQKSGDKGLLRGRVLGISQWIWFEGATPANLEKNFHKAVDEYLEQSLLWENESYDFQKNMETCRNLVERPDFDVFEDGYQLGAWDAQTKVMYSLLREGFSFDEVSRILDYTEEERLKLKPYAMRFFDEVRGKTEEKTDE